MSRTVMTNAMAATLVALALTSCTSPSEPRTDRAETPSATTTPTTTRTPAGHDSSQPQVGELPSSSAPAPAGPSSSASSSEPAPKTSTPAHGTPQAPSAGSRGGDHASDGAAVTLDQFGPKVDKVTVGGIEMGTPPESFRVVAVDGDLATMEAMVDATNVVPVTIKVMPGTPDMSGVVLARARQIDPSIPADKIAGPYGQYSEAKRINAKGNVDVIAVSQEMTGKTFLVVGDYSKLSKMPTYDQQEAVNRRILRMIAAST